MPRLLPKYDNQVLQRALVILLADLVTIALSYFFALWARFEFNLDAIPEEYLRGTMQMLIAALITTVLVYDVAKLYHSIWRYASITEISRIIVAYLAIGILLILEKLVFRFPIPKSVLLVAYILSGLWCLIIRFGYRYARHLRKQMTTQTTERVLLIGAGQAGREILKDIAQRRENNIKVCAIVDDNPLVQNRYLEGIRIRGTREDIPTLAEKYDINRIIYAIPSANGQDRADILNICKEVPNCKIQTLPGISQMINEEVHFSQVRDVDIEDLLGREEVHINVDEILHEITGKVVMVTGGGGSIGSELCRQVAASAPKQLIVFDIYENNAYAIQQELRRKYPNLDLVTLIGSVRNTNRVNWVLQKYHPDIIYHAAAHKHVPLMEDSPNEAIKNNTMGTYKLAMAAGKAGVKRFLLISTDKAVNPTNIMGASKRLCEMIIQMMDRKFPETAFMAVRFGNVLGSNGSVIPLFKKQIAEGGPVTVTDKNIIRYFMTIPEAVSLVLEAGHYAQGGEIFVLDMGEPVRIDDMARNLIKLSGFTPGVDIKIEYTGLRPGEKLFEELLMDEEGMKKTKNKMIYIGNPLEMDDDVFEQQILQLDRASRLESEEIKSIVASIVPTYNPNSID